MEENNLQNKPKYFECVVGKILRENYELVKKTSSVFDFETSNGIFFEVKYTSHSNIHAFFNYLSKLYNPYRSISDLDKTIFVGNVVNDENYPNTWISQNGKCFNILTIENLLYLCGKNDKLKQELVEFLHISTESVKAQRPVFEKMIEKSLSGSKLPDDKKEINENETKEESLIELLNQITPGKNDAKKYEKFCEKLVEEVFNNNIGSITPQQTNNDGLYRFDIIASLKEQPKSFWKFIYDKYNSCFILFECKNYSEEITQKEIYLTERYLYNNSLRNVEVIFSRKGMSDSAYTACQDVLKEHGKLILVLNDKDVTNLIDAYNGKPVDNIIVSSDDILFTKAKKFLMDLRK